MSARCCGMKLFSSSSVSLSTRGSQSGVALVTQQTETSVEGSIFGLRMQNFSGGLTDVFSIVQFKSP